MYQNRYSIIPLEYRPKECTSHRQEDHTHQTVPRYLSQANPSSDQENCSYLLTTLPGQAVQTYLDFGLSTNLACQHPFPSWGWKVGFKDGWLQLDQTTDALLRIMKGWAGRNAFGLPLWAKRGAASPVYLFTCKETCWNFMKILGTWWKCVDSADRNSWKIMESWRIFNLSDAAWWMCWCRRWKCNSQITGRLWLIIYILERWNLLETTWK